MIILSTIYAMHNVCDGMLFKVSAGLFDTLSAQWVEHNPHQFNSFRCLLLLGFQGAR